MKNSEGQEYATNKLPTLHRKLPKNSVTLQLPVYRIGLKLILQLPIN